MHNTSSDYYAIILETHQRRARSPWSTGRSSHDTYTQWSVQREDVPQSQMSLLHPLINLSSRDERGCRQWDRNPCSTNTNRPFISPMPFHSSKFERNLRSGKWKDFFCRNLGEISEQAHEKIVNCLTPLFFKNILKKLLFLQNTFFSAFTGSG